MRRALLIGGLLAAVPAPSEIIDRLVAVVGRQVITQSDVEQEARLEAFFRRQPAPALRVDSPETQALRDRLIRQHLVEQEMEQSTFPPPEAGRLREWLEKMRPAGADPAPWNLAETDLEDYARRQIDVERFIDQRFKPGLQIPEGEIGDYYEKVLLPELERRGIREKPPLAEARGQIEAMLIEERVNQLLDHWLEEARLRTGVRLLEAPRP